MLPTPRCSIDRPTLDERARRADADAIRGRRRRVASCPGRVGSRPRNRRRRLIGDATAGDARPAGRVGDRAARAPRCGRWRWRWSSALALGFAAGFGGDLAAAIGRRRRRTSATGRPRRRRRARRSPPQRGRRSRAVQARGAAASAAAAPATRGGCRSPAPPPTRRQAPARAVDARRRAGARRRPRRTAGRPSTVGNLSRGAHRVRVTRDGYAADERRVTITAAQPAQSVTVALVRAARPPPATRGCRPRRRAAAQPPRRPRRARRRVASRRRERVPRRHGWSAPRRCRCPTCAAGEHALHLELRRLPPLVLVDPRRGDERNRVAASLDRWNGPSIEDRGQHQRPMPTTVQDSDE